MAAIYIIMSVSGKPHTYLVIIILLPMVPFLVYAKPQVTVHNTITVRFDAVVIMGIRTLLNVSNA